MKTLLPVLWSLFAVEAIAQPTLYLRVRDQQTHFAAPATVLVSTATGSQWHETDATGALAIPLSAEERVELAFTAKGYQPLTTYFVPEQDQNIDAEILLDLLALNTQTDVVDVCRIVGYVSDAQTGLPLAGVSVHIGVDTATVMTNTDGLFLHETSRFAALSVPSVVPVRTPIRISREGYGTQELGGFLLTPGAHTIAVSLEPGHTNVFQPQVNGLLDRQLTEDLFNNMLRTENTSACSANASIRVGTSCSCNTCTGVSVMSLEAYVGSGLDNEWISSWASNSLKAGSVAYRSYGAYYTTHPHNGTYDLASSTCRQVWGAETATSCINAAKATAGEVLMQNGATARSEYSAENNAFACADGYTGSPTYGWPCNADNVCQGKTASGHGRGMCQWGSQRWASAQGQAYTWILDHYYSIGGVTRCTLASSTAISAPVADFALIPNPVSDFLVIQTGDKPLRILLHNSLGQPVLSTTNPVVDMRALPRGIYMVTVIFPRRTLHKLLLAE